MRPLPVERQHKTLPQRGAVRPFSSVVVDPAASSLRKTVGGLFVKDNRD
jgi:hypothetical protein